MAKDTRSVGRDVHVETTAVAVAEGPLAMNAHERPQLREGERMATCARDCCRQLFAVCGRCDRGRRYCSSECASTARQNSSVEPASSTSRALEVARRMPCAKPATGDRRQLLLPAGDNYSCRSEPGTG